MCGADVPDEVLEFHAAQWAAAYEAWHEIAAEPEMEPEA